MAPWDRWSRRRSQAAADRLPTKLASSQALANAPSLVLRGGTIKQAWQEKARAYGSQLGIVSFAAGLTALSVSRCPMIPERRLSATDDRWAPDNDPVVNGVLRTYRNERDTGAELVRRHAFLYQITGEALQTVEQGPRGVEWFIHDMDAVLIYPNRPVLVREVPGGSVFNGGAREVPLEQARRFWTPDPYWPLLATSPMVGILDDCERYAVLGRRTKREAKSALGMNGAFWTPELAHKYPAGPDGKPSLYSQLDQDLAAVAAKAWEDDDSPAATSPFSLHYGKDKDDAIQPQWIAMGNPLDAKVLEARREALECIVRGLPIPNVLGIEGTSGAVANHWNGWLISEEFFKGSIAPIADTVYHSDLTASMLRPSLSRLSSSGVWQGDPEDWRVGYDPTPVIIHPDKASRSVELYKEGALSRLAALLECGFGPEDAPSDDELAQFITVQQAIHTRGGYPPGNTVEGPPAQPVSAPQAGALAPYPSEVDGWLADASV